jgi:hypothetical protein
MEGKNDEYTTISPGLHSDDAEATTTPELRVESAGGRMIAPLRVRGLSGFTKMWRFRGFNTGFS